jgi:hypothetical protein
LIRRTNGNDIALDELKRILHQSIDQIFARK